MKPFNGEYKYRRDQGRLLAAHDMAEVFHPEELVNETFKTLFWSKQSSDRVMVQRQLEKVGVAANKWVLLFWFRLALRVSLGWRSFWSRVAKMTSSLPASLSAGAM